jgi:hypothetical protein
MMAMEEAVSKTSRNALKPLFRERENVLAGLEGRVDLLQTEAQRVRMRIFRGEVSTCRFLGGCGQRWMPRNLLYHAAVMGDGPGVSW